MSDDERALTINELADEAGVTRRTVHYYLAQGLLPTSGGEGRNARYGQKHLDRLRLIRELQREHLPLAEIRQRLERLSDEQVGDLVRIGEHIAPPRGSAFDYIQSVLAGTNHRAFAMKVAAPRPATIAPAPPAPAAPSRVTEAPAAYRAAAAAPPPAGATPEAPAEPAGLNRSQWERIALAPDIELHVRRPLSRIQNRAVDKLVGLARQLLEEDQS
jgi:DNA-binding transcriptional MerR regulator